MSSEVADRDGAIVVAPQQRSVPMRKYLTMATTLDPGLAAIQEPDVDRLLELARGRIGAVTLSARSALHFEGLRCLAESVRRDPYYDELGKRSATAFMYNWICKYIRFERDLVEFADIAHVPVQKPMLIVGFGRTGSTFLHQLLALDPQARAPQMWELTEPSPPPRPESYETDSRIRRVQLRIATSAVVMPDIQKIHETDNAQAAEECHHMMWHGPHQVMLGLRSPEYWHWLRNLESQQLQSLYQGYRLQVQHLQLFFPSMHWLSKALAHAFYFPVLFKVFPDACIVRLHRDPCQIVPGLASLLAHSQMFYTDRIDFRELGERMLDIFLHCMQRSMQIENEVGPEHFIDVVFDELIKDPIGTVRKIYSRFGHRYALQLESDMLRFLRTERATRKYKHTYTLEQFGLSRADIMARSEEYLAWVERKTGSRLCSS